MSDLALPVRNRWPHALWAGLLSLVVPGLGQVYAGAWGLGVALYVVAIAIDFSSLAFTRLVPPTPGALSAVATGLLIFRSAVAIDAVRRVRSRPMTAPRPWYRSTWLAAVVMIAIGIGVQLAREDSYSPGWRSFHVASGSNMPTLLTTDYVMVDTSRSGVVPAYGDMIVFRHPRDPKVDYIKRVVGLPGDRVQLRSGTLYLNDKAVPREPQGEQYRETLPNGRSYMILETPQSASASTEEFKVPADSLFVLGDNRGNSLDSRHKEVGYVPVANVVGPVRTIYWSTDPSRFLSRVQ
jgi:signal peptidase I